MKALISLLALTALLPAIESVAAEVRTVPVRKEIVFKTSTLLGDSADGKQPLAVSVRVAEIKNGSHQAVVEADTFYTFAGRPVFSQHLRERSYPLETSGAPGVSNMASKVVTFGTHFIAIPSVVEDGGKSRVVSFVQIEHAGHGDGGVQPYDIPNLKACVVANEVSAEPGELVELDLCGQAVVQFSIALAGPPVLTMPEAANGGKVLGAGD